MATTLDTAAPGSAGGTAPDMLVATGTSFVGSGMGRVDGSTFMGSWRGVGTTLDAAAPAAGGDAAADAAAAVSLKGSGLGEVEVVCAAASEVLGGADIEAAIAAAGGLVWESSKSRSAGIVSAFGSHWLTFTRGIEVRPKPSNNYKPITL